MEEKQNTPIVSTNGSHSGFKIPEFVLDDLCSRFIINLPEEERTDLIRIFFQVELAHWFYLDFYCQENPDLKACGIKDFSSKIFRHCPFLREHSENVDKILEQWKEYKMAVPTYGAILLDPSLQYCLLVQGYWAKSSWGFPKGKVNEDEEDYMCAIREVLEETGFDISLLIDQSAFIEFKMNEQLSRLYIVHNVSMETKFLPKTRREIKNLEWFRVDQLPSHKKDLVCKTKLGMNPNAFFMVIPFVKQLRKWISKHQGSGDSSDLDNGNQHHQALKHATNNRNKDNREHAGDTKQLTDKQRLRQQQYFAQHSQMDFQDLYKLKQSNKSAKSATTSSSRTRSASPVLRFHKLGHKSVSPNQGKKKKYILKRDGTVAGSSRRSLSEQFSITGDIRNEVSHRKARQNLNELGSQAWLNFKFDASAIMACIP